MEVADARHTLQPGNRLSLQIEDIAFGGEGVARYEGIVVFVPFVIPGEKVEVEIVEAKKAFARARLLNVVEPSPERVQPECPYFGDCGGCQYQHLSYDRQLAIKHKQIADLFERMGGFPASLIAPMIPCPRHYGYRNRIMIRSQWDKFKQGLNIGFIRHDNRLVVDIDACRIAEPALNAQIQHVRQHPPPKGGIKVVLRIAPEGWEVPRDSFFQNNFFLLPQLVEVVKAMVRSAGTRFLIDAYCGVGFFSIELAGTVERFVGIEVDAMAIKAARANATARGASNGEYVTGRTEELLPGYLATFDAGQTTVLIDPPRVGCEVGLLSALKSAAPAQILYVSCNPATLVRDLKVLCSEGEFTVLGVTPLDMFPQTQHAECVADIRSLRATNPTAPHA